MKILDIISKNAISRKILWSIENLDDGFLIAILPNILQKEKMKSDEPFTGWKDQTSKVWNFAGDVHIEYSHNLVFKDFTNFKRFQLSQ